MITKQRKLFYFVGETPYASLAEAQTVDLTKLMPAVWLEDRSKEVSAWLLAESKSIVDILTTTPTSRLRGRKSHGATRKPRTPKAPTTQAAT